MTREDNITVPLLDRTKIANDANADVFISIHVNSRNHQPFTVLRPILLILRLMDTLKWSR